MHRHRKWWFSLLWLISLLGLLFAEEGMWLLDQLEVLEWDRLQKMGLQLSPEDIRTLSGAVVIIDGGTGEFVSADGLLLTNHHVAYSGIQRVSTPEQNYLENGFYAPSRKEELPVKGYEAYVLRSMEDVTDRVLSAVTEDMKPLERYQALAQRKEELARAAEKEAFLDASVVEMFSGVKYYLVVYEKFPDVRLVYAPPASIGKYGGDIDNWMWPRHTGDFSFFRVYAGKDNRPAEYSKDNVPYHPSTYLPISTEGVKEGDFTFILGYPGNTYRYRTSNSVEYHQKVSYPFQIDLFTTGINILERISENDPEARLKVADFLAGLNNGLKNNQGMLDGFRKLQLVEKKKAFEQEFRAFLKAHPELQKEYGTVLDDIHALYEELMTFAHKMNLMRMMNFTQVPRMIATAYRYAEEKQKPEAERDPRYSERSIQQQLRFVDVMEQEYVPAVDREFVKAFFLKAAELPEGQRIGFVDEIIGDRRGEELAAYVEEYVEDLFARTGIRTPKDAAALFQKSPEELRRMDDPLVQLALHYAEAQKPIDQKTKAFSAEVTRLRAKYARALFAWKGNALYPDANRTLRFTYGTVQRYSPRDAVIYLSKTTLSGVVEKHTGREPFNAPDKLL
ncbi:MAG: S46 family peptidase, partial [Calditrichaeota bacterium]